MRHLVFFTVPHEPFNSYVKDGTAGQKVGRIIEETKPEAIYFSTSDGQRGGVAVYNVPNASDIPSIAEPWFLTFEADCHFQPCMTPDDLMAAGLDDLGSKWG